MTQKLILHVEDDLNEAFFLRRAFEREHLPYLLRQVAAGDEGIAYLAGLPPFERSLQNPSPALVLLDLKLPGMNGFDVLAWAKRTHKLDETPIVVLTSSDRPEDIERATELGAASYLTKSVSYHNVLSFLQNWKDRPT